MKVRFYCDIWPGYQPHMLLFANTQPNTGKPEGGRRLAFDVVIPDWMTHEVDAISPEPARVSVVEGE